MLRSIVSFLSTAPSVLKVLAILLLGLGLGAVVDRLLIHETLPGMTVAALPWLAGLAAALVISIIVLFMFKNALARRLKGEQWLHAARLALDGVQQKVAQWLYGVEPKGSNLNNGELAEHLQNLRDLATASVKALLVGYGMRQAILLLGIVLGGTVGFATLLTAYLQVDRLDAQNRLISLQTQLLVEEQEFQIKRERAEAAYKQIADILLDPDSIEQSQVLALGLIPEAMRMSVPRSVVSEGNGLNVEYVQEFPNATRLRRVLLAYMRHDRIGRALHRAGLLDRGQTERDVPWDEFQRAVAPLGVVSNAILMTLHRLGPPDQTAPHASLWAIAEQEDALARTLPREGMTTRREGERVISRWGRLELAPAREPPEPRLIDEHPVYGRHKALIYDLTHLGHADLMGVQLPFLHAHPRLQDRVQVNLRHKARLDDARLEGAQLYRMDWNEASLDRVSLRGAALRETVMNGVSFEGGDLRGADLSTAQLHGFAARGAWLQGADLGSTELWAADLGAAHLEGANMEAAQLNGAWLREAFLNSASLAGAQLIGADLRWVRLNDARLEVAVLSGAALGADLQGANLARARLHGARLAEASLAGANLAEALLNAASVPLRRYASRRPDGDERSVFIRPLADGDGSSKQFPAALLSSDSGRVSANFGTSELMCLSHVTSEEADWLGSIWHLDPSLVRRLCWRPDDADMALPHEMQAVQPSLLRRTRTKETLVKGADFTGVAVPALLFARLQAQGVRFLDRTSDMTECDFWSAYPLPLSPGDTDAPQCPPVREDAGDSP